MSTRLETARLVIRTFEHRDAEPWIAMVSDPEVRRYLPPTPLPTMHEQPISQLVVLFGPPHDEAHQVLLRP